MNREIELIRSKRRTLVIEITPDAKVVVRAPLKVSVDEINRFIGEKADWIDKHLKMMEKRKMERESADVKPLSRQEIKLLTTRAKRILPERVRYYADIMGVQYGRITIRMQKSRWGSCSSKKNLNFNCLLMLTPQEIIDYVIVHELCHLKEMNHSPRFWAEVEKVLPDYKERRKWLRDHEKEIIF
ncbi:MAG: M48 family metallopeptidase [Lachnospiraceae bacterium]|nr:M48 family metallopeptidase [Lachnospiraceae bacterium]